MYGWQIDSYKVRLELLRAGNPVMTHRNRILELSSVTLYHGLLARAVLNFSTYWDNWSGTPAIGFSNSSNPMLEMIFGWLPSNEFSFWYDLLRSEKPLMFFYEVTPIGGAPYVSKISIGSSVEPLGEGPTDVSG